MSKTDLRENLLAARLEKVVQWVMDHRPLVLTMVGVTVAVALIGSVFVLRRQEKTDLAWTQLSRAQSYRAQNKNDETRQILNDVRATSPDTDSRLHASFYLADLALAEKKPDEAIGFLNDVVAAAGKRPILPLALSNLGFAYEEKGDLSAAAETYRKFMAQFPQHFLAPRVQLSLGRVLAQTADVAGATETLTHLIELYPTSPWAEKARQIMDKIKTR